MSTNWTPNDVKYLRPLYEEKIVFNPDGWVYAATNGDKIVMEGGSNTFAKLKKVGFLDKKDYEISAGVGQHAKMPRRRFIYVLNAEGRAHFSEFFGID